VPVASNEQLLFANWLRETQRLQVESFDIDPNQLGGEELAEYVTWNVAALVAELGEVLQAFPTWKPWITSGRGELTEEERDHVVEELVDVTHFLGNLLCAMDVDDEELSRVYRIKQQVNRDRHAGRAYAGHRTET
jgi:NTP pyrophosphatase (non-canonical NTP hydrolase)